MENTQKEAVETDDYSMVYREVTLVAYICFFPVEYENNSSSDDANK